MAEETKTKGKKPNVWVLSTIILAALTITLSVFLFNGGLTGHAISVTGNEAAEKGIDFINNYVAQGGGVTLDSVKEVSGLYFVQVNYKGNKIPVYMSKDGNLIDFGQGMIDIAVAEAAAKAEEQQTSAPKNITKSDKPKVEAFIFSYCPYGLQFEKALLPVYDLLKDKADINIVAIGAMHGEHEKTESLRQISIEQLYGRDKLFAYLNEFDTNSSIGACSGDATCLDKYLPSIYTKLGINKTKVEDYMSTSAEQIYNQQGARASSLGISSSPTFVINGVESQVSRTPEAIKEAICNAFTTAPSECSQNLSKTSPSAGFGASTGSAASAASCG